MTQKETNLIKVNQVLSGLIIAGIIGLFTKLTSLESNVMVSVAERQSLKEDIIELKHEVQTLRALVYRSIQKDEEQK